MRLTRWQLDTGAAFQGNRVVGTVAVEINQN
jgi:hypothetical protein